MGDITYLPLAGGGLCLATVLDCFSRRAVGWSIADHMRTRLVSDALRMAARTRGVVSIGKGDQPKDLMVVQFSGTTIFTGAPVGVGVQDVGVGTVVGLDRGRP